MRWLVRAAWLAVLVVVLAIARPAAAAPSLVDLGRTGRITMRAERGLEATGRQLAQQGDAILNRIAADLMELPVPSSVEVRLVRDSRDLAEVAPAGRGAPPWAIGVAYPDLRIVAVAMRRGHAPIDAMSTLRHELGHIALGVALGPRAPRWLHEGFAYQHSGEWTWERTETLAGMAWFNSFIPLDQLDRSFPAEELPANRAYAESYDFVGYLSRRGRWEDHADDGDRWPFRRFLSDVGRTGDLDAAANNAFGRPLRELFHEWQRDLSNRYMFMPIGLLGFAIWVFCALLLVAAWLRRRRQNRTRLAQWDREDRERAAAAPLVVAPAYVPWPGEDPLAELPEDDPRGPRTMN
ncbi:MAG: hypothetical protein AB7O24_12550 [Kofleriaceae bacterium]